jgi:hypothetical protein
VKSLLPEPLVCTYGTWMGLQRPLTRTGKADEVGLPRVYSEDTKSAGRRRRYNHILRSSCVVHIFMHDLQSYLHYTI